MNTNANANINVIAFAQVCAGSSIGVARLFSCEFLVQMLHLKWLYDVYLKASQMILQ